tara:strand:+ start:2025 stop:2783 length:759 start_codon:yes stop_codon:yes gene_type:complete
MKRGFQILCLVQICFFVLFFQARAGNNDAELKRYNQCMSQSRTHPENGIEMARTWLAEGDFSAAKHCLATGKFFSGAYEAAATIFENLATTDDDFTDQLRSQLFSQAGQARLLIGQSKKALENQTAALNFVRDEPQFFLDRAITQIALKDYTGALSDINIAIKKDPLFGDALLFSAIAKRHLKDFFGALADINKSLMLLPNLPAALLERGIIFNLVGQAESAATDWKKIIEVAPNSAEARIAKEWMDQVKNK